MLDSQEASRVGTYELLFFVDDGCSTPMLRLAIGPRLQLHRQSPAMGPGASPASQRRSSMGCNQPTFEISAPGIGPFGLVFDLEAEAADFARDFVVRHRLVALSLKTSRGWRMVEELKDELDDMRRRGILATAQRLLYQAMLLIGISLFIYACVLYSSEPQRSPLDVALLAISDATTAFFSVFGLVADSGAAVCGTFSSRSISTADLQQCITLPDAFDVRSCAAALARGSTWG